MEMIISDHGLTPLFGGLGALRHKSLKDCVQQKCGIDIRGQASLRGYLSSVMQGLCLLSRNVEFCLVLVPATVGDSEQPSPGATMQRPPAHKTTLSLSFS